MHQNKSTIQRTIRKKRYCNLNACKSRGVVIMNRDKYKKKCLEMLNTNQFVKLNSDPTKTTERKVQNVLWKNKS